MGLQAKALRLAALLACVGWSAPAAPPPEAAAADPAPTLTARCRTGDPCVFLGRDLFIDLRIANRGKTEIKFPLQLAKQSGPSIRLVDTRTGKDAWLRTTAADFGLRNEVTSLGPGQSVSVEWLITADELRAPGGDPVDVTAEIALIATVAAPGGVDRYLKGTLRIKAR